MIKYEVIDNYLPLTDFMSITDTIDGDENSFRTSEFPWFYNRFVDDRKKEELNDHFYFTHLLLSKNVVNSKFYDNVMPLINKIKPNALIRVKVNAYPKNGNELIRHRPHTDYPFEHKGAIFYLNTNDGKTILEDGTEIDSVANRILFFDPSKPHSSTNCTDAKMRFNINVNYF